MSYFRADQLPDDPERLELRRDAQIVLMAYRACLAHPAFQHRIDLGVLSKIAADPNMPARERRKAAGMLATIFGQAVDQFARVAGVREQTLERLGLGGPKDVPTQIMVNVGVPTVVPPASLATGNSPAPSGADEDAPPAPPRLPAPPVPPATAQG